MLVLVRILKRLIWDVWLVPINYFTDLMAKPGCSSPVTQNLFDNGLHISDELVSEGTLVLLNKVYSDLQRTGSIAEAGQNAGRLYKNGMLDSRLTDVVENMRKIASSYLCVRKAKLELTYFQTSEPRKDRNDVPGADFHIDDNKANVKVFVYLSDVGDTNGPFVVVPKTHRWRDKGRIKRALCFAITKDEPNYLYYNDNMNFLEERALYITGVAGKWFVTDTTAWHRAQPVVSGCRKVFVASFNR
jgi:ectoine hydroxylase-related dioxygenase (phytanoyl-CoA dioxygenase family)